ncbi:MAG: hypothetical protein NT154_00125, partial [Verrucomicrobia bacterium]|nr:hypothetical protein [Verrucomicrobiota bacterium]
GQKTSPMDHNCIRKPLRHIPTSSTGATTTATLPLVPAWLLLHELALAIGQPGEIAVDMQPGAF